MLSLTGKSVMVTGGAGFIGSHLVDRLVLEAPSNIVVVDNFFLGKMRNLDDARRSFPSLKVHDHDASDYEAMRETMAVEATDVVFNLAVVPLPTSLVRPRWSADTNFAIVSVVCELLRQGCFDTLVHFSSSEVYGTAQYVPMDEQHPLAPSTPYAASKAGGDHLVNSYLETFGLDATTVRPFNGFGPRQNEKAYAGVIPTVIGRVLAGEPLEIYGDGDQTRDFTYVGEIAEAAVRSYLSPSTRGRVVNISSGREVSVNALVEKLLITLDRDVSVSRSSPRPGDVRRHCGSPALGEQLTGFRPRRSLEAGLEETVRWYQERLSQSSHAD